MAAPTLPTLHVVCGNDREGDPRLHAFIDRMVELGTVLEVIFVDPLGQDDMGSWAAATLDRIMDGRTDDAPVHLLGYCIGGAILHELVHAASPGEIGFGYVGLLDHRVSRPMERLRQGVYARFRVRRSRRIRELVSLLGPPDGVSVHTLLGASIRAILLGPYDLVGRRIRNRHRHGLLGRGRWSDRKWLAARLGYDWWYPQVQFPVHLYTTEDSMDRWSLGDPSNGLSTYLIGGFTLHRIPGDHFTCIQAPNQDALIALIERDRLTVERDRPAGVAPSADASGDALRGGSGTRSAAAAGGSAP